MPTCQLTLVPMVVIVDLPKSAFLFLIYFALFVLHVSDHLWLISILRQRQNLNFYFAQDKLFDNYQTV